ncbi:SKDA1 protein, partial [Amia calva]|nr:SKDA1 protein [Amia calva]
MEYDCELRDGACQTGHQEIEGVSMGYLRVEGRKMFALAQVFSALFRDIPRTTIMKRMEVLNIRSRRCDIKELRTLKAMQSVPGRAVKCSLIAKEDLDALCLACQALSPKKRRKRRKCRKSEPALALNLNFAQRKGKPGAAGSRKRGRCAQGTSTGYSSDSGSSVDFEKDSDFGSSYQSTSSESSDEDDNLDGRSAQSSSSEEGSSSETDSSSACSGDSVQSTRYRQAALPTPTSRFPSHGARGSAPEDIPALSTASDVYKSSPPAPAPFLEIKIKTEPSPSFGCLGVATVKNEPSSAGPVSGEGSEREAERAAALRGHSARQGASAICPDGSRQFLQQKSPSLHPEGGFEAAPPLLKNGNYLHKGAPDNGHSLGLSNQAQSQPEDLSQESALAGSPLRSCEAPAVAPGLGCTEPERINIDSGPQGDTREPRTEKFERLIRTSKLWCYAKGFNFDSKNGGFASAAAYSAGPRASKSKPAKSHLAHSGGSGGCLLKRCSSPRPRGRPALSSKALKVNGLERNLKGTRAPRGSDAERLQRCSKETSNRDSNGNIGRKGSAAGGAVTPSCKRKASGSSLPQTPVKRSFSLLENFPCPPSLVVGKDGDLSPAYSLCSQKCLPHKLAHPPCRMWQLGGSILPVPPSHRFRGYNLDGND